MIRAFIAVEPSADVRRNVSSFQRERKKTLPPMNWVQSESIHLTLRFLGSIEPSCIPQLLSVLKPIGDKTGKFSLDVHGVGVFPNRQRPSIFWVGVSGQTLNLQRLVLKIAAALEPLGFPLEEKAYHPHLTLARIKRDNASVGSALLEKGALESDHHLGTLTVDRFVLFQSDLNPTGACYTPLGTVQLSANSLG